MASITLNNPTQDGFIEKYNTTYYHNYIADDLDMGPPAPAIGGDIFRSYVEWDISDIPDGSTITLVKFKYQGRIYHTDCEVRAMASQPTAQADTQAGRQVIYDDAGDGTIYAAPSGFPVEGTNKEIDLGEDACTDLQNGLSANWFAIGIQNIDEVYDEYNDKTNAIRAEDFSSVTPPPTLYVEYTAGGGTTQTSTAKARVRALGVTKNTTAKTRVKQLAKTKTVTTKAGIKKEGLTKTVTSRGGVKQSDLIKTIQVKAQTKQLGITQALQAKAWINYIGARVSKAILVNPEDLGSSSSPVTFVWEIPESLNDENVHCQIQVDKTDNTFGDLEVDFKSLENVGFEYWDGDSWEAYPTEGVDALFSGNQARISANLTNGGKYWRARGIIK